MLFNSLEFALFLPLVFLLYWLAAQRDLRVQNGMLLIASYVFYGWWDWRFLSLIAISSAVDFLVGLNLGRQNSPARRRLILLASIIVNLGFLGFFKYFNFFAESFADAFTLFGRSFTPARLKIILPVGISFYTFQTVSYTIDVYRRETEPTRDMIAFFAFVAFFPQLVAGPIERARNLLPQFTRSRTFEYHKAADGMRQIIWGLFKKVVIADNCAAFVDTAFSRCTECSAGTLILGAVLFAFQIYGDFSGYSDIAIGTARLFGFSLVRNFAYPYFSRDVAEFWRRWHISLSSWFRDYVYIPLGGSRCGNWTRIRNTFIIFLVSGLWHGANWTFVIWGFLNALYFLPLMLLHRNRIHLDTVSPGRKLPSLRESGQILLTFSLTTFAWIFFRAENLGHAVTYITMLFRGPLLVMPEIASSALVGLIASIGIMTAVEWMQREKQHGLQLDGRRIPAPVRWLVYYALVVGILLLGGEQQAFIYFQF